MEPKDPVDPTESFYQQLDSEQVLLAHGEELYRGALEMLAQHPEHRFAGVLGMPDSKEARSLAQALAQMTGRPEEQGLLIAVVPRPFVEPILRKYVDPAHWEEQPWQRQRVFPVVVATKDGFRFGFHVLPGEANENEAGA